MSVSAQDVPQRFRLCRNRNAMQHFKVTEQTIKTPETKATNEDFLC